MATKKELEERIRELEEENEELQTKLDDIADLALPEEEEESEGEGEGEEEEEQPAESAAPGSQPRTSRGQAAQSSGLSSPCDRR